MNNIMTEAMLKLSKMMIDTDEKLKTLGTLPYGQRLATPMERKAGKIVDKEMSKEMLYD